MLTYDCYVLICRQIDDPNTFIAFALCNRKMAQVARSCYQNKTLKWYRYYGERAKAFVYVNGDIESLKKLSEQMKIGDIAYTTTGYRSTETYIKYYNELICKISIDTAGYGCVPMKIIKYIENPQDFYSDCVGNKLYQGVYSTEELI